MNIEYVSDVTTNFKDLKVGDVFSFRSVVYMKVIDVVNSNCHTWRYNAVRLEDGVLEYFLESDVIPLSADLTVCRRDR